MGNHIGLCRSGRIRHARLPDGQELPDGVLGTATKLSLKGTYEKIALHIIDCMSSEEPTAKETLSSVLAIIQVIVTQLDDAPMGIGTGLRICCSVLQKCQDVLAVDNSIRMLVLDVVLVCELMSSALEALVKQREQQQVSTGGEQPAPPAAAAEQGVGGMQPHPLQQYNSIADAINRVLKEEAYEDFLKSNGGKVHVAYLYMALDVARKLINEYDQQDTCVPWKALAAGSTIAKAQAATELLARARDRFCQSIVTGKALGELAAESVANTQAKQAGLRAQTGVFIMENDERMQMFLVDQELDDKYLGDGGGSSGGGSSGGSGGKRGGDGGGRGSGKGGGSGGGSGRDGAADSGPSHGGGGGAVTSSVYGPDILWDGKNGDVPRKCMALKYTSASLEQCKNKAKMVFDPEDEDSGPAGKRRRHVVCVCAMHGGGFSLLQRADLRYPVRQLDDLRYPVRQLDDLHVDDTKVRLGPKQEEFRYCLRMSAAQARKYTSVPDWCALQRELQKKKAVDGKYRCAHGECSAVPKRFYAKYGREDLHGGRRGNEADLICVCGMPGCNAALDASSDWKLVYTHESLIGETKQRGSLETNMEAFKRWADAAL